MQVNQENFYPLYHAVNSLCEKNIAAVIEAAKKDEHKIKFSKVINMKFDGRNNLLHKLFDEITNESFFRISKVIRILINNGCSPNLINDQGETPIDILCKANIDQDRKNELIQYAFDNSDVNLRPCSQETLSCLARYQSDVVINMSDFYYMHCNLDDENELDFINNFHADNYDQAQLSSLLEVAVAKNMIKAVKLLIQSSVSVNELLKYSRYGKEPAFLAANMGHVEIFKLFVNRQLGLQFVDQRKKRNLLHEILSSQDIELDQLKEIFILIIMDSRCSLELINAMDDEENSPLYYACLNGYDDIVNDLLKRGAYVGSEGVIKNLRPNFLESFLDECLTIEQKSSHVKEIQINYQFLVPSFIESGKLNLNSGALKKVATNQNLCSLLKHPVLSSFSDLIWNRYKNFIYLFSMMHFFCLLYEVWYLAYFLPNFDSFEGKTQEAFYFPFVLILFMLLLTEVIELWFSARTYFLKLGNWLDMVMIGTIFSIIFLGIDEYEIQHISAFLVLVVSFQSIKVFGVSVYITIFRKVCSTFFKLFLTYSPLFLAFALGFQVLFLADMNPETIRDIKLKDNLENASWFGGKILQWRNETEGDYKTFGNIGVSFYRVMAMFVGEINSEHFNDPFKMAMVILFILFMFLVLQNLMNSMAIIDTQQIISEAELIGQKKRIKLVHKYEMFFSLIGFGYSEIFALENFNKYSLTSNTGEIIQHDPLQCCNNISIKNKPCKLILSKTAVKSISKHLTGGAFICFDKNKSTYSKRFRLRQNILLFLVFFYGVFVFYKLHV